MLLGESWRQEEELMWETPERQAMGSSDLAKEPNISSTSPEPSTQPDDAEG